VSARRRAVLIVEDDFTTRRLLEVVLGGQGYEVHAASDAEGGLEILDLYPIDLVLLDLVLPRASGVEFLMVRRTLDPARQPPVIVISAAPELDAMWTELRYLGISLAMGKPFNIEALLAAVATLARKRRHRKPSHRQEVAVKAAGA
jgi:DNA-binding response OmpR family regulator